MDIYTRTESLDVYKKYISIEEAIHEYLQRYGYLKIDLPVLSPALIPESYLEVFATRFTYLKNEEKLYLTPSPELFLKRLLVAGIGSCYFLGKAFRNAEPNSPLHSPEFTMLEFYKTGADYRDIAAEVLGLLQAITQKLYGRLSISYKGQVISLKKWETLTVAQAFKKYAGTNNIFDQSELFKTAKKKGYQTDGFSYEEIFSQMYVQEVERHLGMHGYPTLIKDYPKEMAALAKLNPDQKTAQRFEFYIGGVELGDCYSELTDWKELQIRFRAEQKKRKKSGKIDHPIDKGYVKALKKGLGDCAGIAIGLERLAMVFTNKRNIHELKLIEIR
ncbi:hypothetical protein HY214_05080 [Candidatus Roizmanbacteria bacterium]|nr:hypothetical protein [Candidatus Roizmanbacteria bacterium]